MRPALVAIVLAGCGFRHGLGPGAGDDVDPDARDSDPDGAGVVIDAARDPAALYCDPTDTALVACYPFDGDAHDVSSRALDASLTNVSFAAGKVGMAMVFGSTSAADVPDTTAFDVSAFTLEAWLDPAQLPAAGERMGILDMNGQYGFFLLPGGDLRCTGGGLAVQVTAKVMVSAWTHVACTYDGSTLAIYANGAPLGTMGGGGALSTGGTTGISIAADNPPGSGSRLDGMIDELRFLAVARSAADIAIDAATTP